MKKWFMILIILITALGLVGCTAGISMTITPNPIDFASGDDLVNATVTVTTTGMGALTISRITAVLYEADNADTILYSYDTDDRQDFPIQIPFVVNGYSKTFELKDYLGEKTVTNLIDENGAEIGVATYDDLKGKTYKLKVEVTTDTATISEVIVNFN